MIYIPDILIPAAGLSERMGKWKLGLQWYKSSVLETVVNNTRTFKNARVIVLVGNRMKETMDLLKHHPRIEIIAVKNWESGMDETIRYGIQFLSTPNFFVTPADMPAIQPEDYWRLVANFDGRTCRPTYDGRPGHPVLINSDDAHRIRQSPSGLPLRHVLSTGSVKMIPWNHDGVVTDLDTERAYREALSKVKEDLRVSFTNIDPSKRSF